MVFSELDEFDFHRRIEGTAGIAVVLFSGPDCGACRRLEKHLPEWLAGLVQQLYKVDVQKSTALARAFDVFHLPALFVFVDGRYHAPLSAEAAPAPLREALARVLGEPAHEEP